MNPVALWVVFAALAVVLVVTAIGVFNLLSRSPHQASRSNMLMRWRVLAQFVAVLLLVAAGMLWGIR